MRRSSLSIADIAVEREIDGNMDDVRNVSSNMAAILVVNTALGDGTFTNIGLVLQEPLVSDIGTVAGIAADVSAVAANAANITAVANNEADISAVAADLVAITGVITNLAAILAVYAGLANIGLVAANMVDVNTVAGISGDVTLVAANVPAIAANVGLIENLTASAESIPSSSPADAVVNGYDIHMFIPQGANGVNGNDGQTAEYEFVYNVTTGDLEYNLTGYTAGAAPIVEEW